MISRKEFDDIQIGDYIQIVNDTRSNCGNITGKMSCLLGKIFPITRERGIDSFCKTRGMVRTYLTIKAPYDDTRDYWLITEEDISCVIKAKEFNLDNYRVVNDDKLEKMLQF